MWFGAPDGATELLLGKGLILGEAMIGIANVVVEVAPLFVMCDQLRWHDLSCYGQARFHTSNIDALPERGVRYDRAYVQWCIAHVDLYGALCACTRGQLEFCADKSG